MVKIISGCSQRKAPDQTTSLKTAPVYGLAGPTGVWPATITGANKNIAMPPGEQK